MGAPRTFRKREKAVRKHISVFNRLYISCQLNRMDRSWFVHQCYETYSCLRSAVSHPWRCFGMLLSPGQKVRNSDMHLLDMVSTEQTPRHAQMFRITSCMYIIIYKVTFSTLKCFLFIYYYYLINYYYKSE